MLPNTTTNKRAGGMSKSVAIFKIDLIIAKVQMPTRTGKPSFAVL